MNRRRRTLALFGLSAVCAGAAASIVNGYAGNVRAQVGPLVPVLVARSPIPRDKTITPRNLAAYVTSRRVPERFVPADALRQPADAVGLRAAVPVAAGSYLETQLRPPQPHVTGRGGGEGDGRVVEVTVAGAAVAGLAPGARVDVLITSDRGTGTPRTYLAIQKVELIALKAGGEADAGGGHAASATAALRVSLRQAVLLTAAQNFAREVRLVPRAAGDSRRVAPTIVTADALHP